MRSTFSTATTGQRDDHVADDAHREQGVEAEDERPGRQADPVGDPAEPARGPDRGRLDLRRAAAAAGRGRLGCPGRARREPAGGQRERHHRSNHGHDEHDQEAELPGRGRPLHEHTGQDTWAKSILAVARGGRIVTCGATSGYEALTDLRHVFSRQVRILGSYMGRRAELFEVLGLA